MARSARRGSRNHLAIAHDLQLVVWKLRVRSRVDFQGAVLARIQGEARARFMPVHCKHQHWAVGHERTTPLQSVHPALVRELALHMRVYTIRADRDEGRHLVSTRCGGQLET